MTQYNDYETKEIGFYGNGTETFFINKNGACFVIQSPDLVDVADAVRVDNFLPVDAVQLGTADIDGIDVPEWCHEYATGTMTETLADSPRFEIESASIETDGEWRNDGIGTPNEFDSEEEAEQAIEALKQLGGDWAECEYRVVEIN